MEDSIRSIKMESSEAVIGEEREGQNHGEDVDEVWSWGAGTEGQLGTGRLDDELLPQKLSIPLSLSSTGAITSLSCGGAHVVALTSGGRVFTWGRGTSGQLGHGDADNSLHPKLVNPLESYSITQVSAGWSHSGFVSESGFLFTCGDGSFGQLGHGDNRSHFSPARVLYFLDKHVEQIACGMRHSLVLLTGGVESETYGFGSGKRGQLGTSKNRIHSVNLPQVIKGLEHAKIIRLYANGDHSAALSDGGHLFTWGRGFRGSPDASCPEALASPLLFAEAALGWNHALLLTFDREVFMLGGNRHGMLGDLEKLSSVKQPIDLREALLEQVPSFYNTKITQIAAGAEHSALVTEHGEVYTWGWGEHGQLGLGDTCDKTSPQLVDLGYTDMNKGASSFRVYCGSGFTYVIKSHIQSPCQR